MALREVRVSLAEEKTLGLSDFVIEDISYDPNSLVITAQVRNIGTQDSGVAVAFYRGDGKMRSELGIVESPVASPGEMVNASFSLPASAPGSFDVCVTTKLYYRCRAAEPGDGDKVARGDKFQA